MSLPLSGVCESLSVCVFTHSQCECVSQCGFLSRSVDVSFPLSVCGCLSMGMSLSVCGCLCLGVCVSVSLGLCLSQCVCVPCYFCVPYSQFYS